MSKPNDCVVFSQIGDYCAPIVIATSKRADAGVSRFADTLTDFQRARDAAGGWAE